MFKILSVLIIAVTISACNNHSTPKEKEKPADSVPPVTEPVKDTLPRLKDITINEAYFEQRVKQVKKLPDSTIQSLLLTDIEDINRATDVPVKILDTLWTIDQEKIILVALNGDSESSAYIVHLKNNKLLQFEEVYYADVVEYIMQTSSDIKDNQLTIVTTTDTDGKTSKSTTRFVFKEGRLQKIN